MAEMLIFISTAVILCRIFSMCSWMFLFHPCTYFSNQTEMALCSSTSVLFCSSKWNWESSRRSLPALFRTNNEVKMKGWKLSIIVISFINCAPTTVSGTYLNLSATWSIQSQLNYLQQDSDMIIDLIALLQTNWFTEHPSLQHNYILV